jgi:hypothetical protein
MTQAYAQQQEILKLFQATVVNSLTEEEIKDLSIYKSLVIDSMYNLLAKIFSEIYEIHKDQWQEITQDYLEHCPSKSPIYNRLCADFPEFISSDFFKEKYSSSNFLSDLAKFKWLDLEVYNQKEKTRLTNGFIQNYVYFESKFNISLIQNYLKEEKIAINEDIEVTPTKFFIYRADMDSRVLILNEMTALFISMLEENLELREIKKQFLIQNREIENLEEQVDSLIDYLKKMKILLI